MKIANGRPAARGAVAIGVLCKILMVVGAALLSAHAVAEQCRTCYQPLPLAGRHASGCDEAAVPLGSVTVTAGIPKIFHRIYIADPKDPIRYAPGFG